MAVERPQSGPASSRPLVECFTYCGVNEKVRCTPTVEKGTFSMTQYDEPIKPRLHHATPLSNRLNNRLNVCLHDEAGCSTGCSTGVTTDWTTRMYRVYKQSTSCPTGSSTACVVSQPRLNNRLHRVNKHSTSCQTSWTTGLITG